MNIHIDGINRVLSNIQRKYGDAGRHMEKGLAKACKIVEGEARANAPVKTGRLRSSITSEVYGNIGVVSSNVEYAPYVEFGTYKMRAQPFLFPALKNKQSEVIKAIADSFKG